MRVGLLSCPGVRLLRHAAIFIPGLFIVFTGFYRATQNSFPKGVAKS